MTVDYCLGSVECMQIFVSLMENEWKLSHSEQLGYLNAIYDLIDYCKLTGVSSDILTSFRDIYLKKAKKYISKRMKVQWNKALDIETLESKGRWVHYSKVSHSISINTNVFQKSAE